MKLTTERLALIVGVPQQQTIAENQQVFVIEGLDVRRHAVPVNLDAAAQSAQMQPGDFRVGFHPLNVAGPQIDFQIISRLGVSHLLTPAWFWLVNYLSNPNVYLYQRGSRSVKPQIVTYNL